MNKFTESYAKKMNEAMTQAANNWWNSLTKEELLAYLQDSPEITADVLRTMLRNEQATLSIGSSFNTVTRTASASFFNAQNNGDSDDV